MGKNIQNPTIDSELKKKIKIIGTKWRKKIHL